MVQEPGHITHCSIMARGILSLSLYLLRMFERSCGFVDALCHREDLSTTILQRSISLVPPGVDHARIDGGTVKRRYVCEREREERGGEGILIVSYVILVNWKRCVTLYSN